MLTGAFAAMVTPFKDGKVDEPAITRFLDYLVINGSNGVVPCGTTGESATLSFDEHVRVIEHTVQMAAERFPVIAGTGSNSTAETIMLTKRAEDLGANAALVITPYYNKPTQQGLYEHYKRVSEDTAIPIILYNVPGRTSVNMLPETVARLSELKNVIGIKEATGDLKQVSDVIEFSKKGFSVLSGDDFTTLPLLAIGGHGVISVTANIVPRAVTELIRLHRDGKFEAAVGLHYKLQALNRAMFLETNPVPVKTALALLGMIEEEVRLPLVRLSEASRAKLIEILRTYGFKIEKN
ncbi:MAG: 4-hydroxy-tetrahydrodipicolinate synthase [Deltaproteobacteria bacterium]|nr:4-hydroxy-tetrahydrodipicolinate synthase [Deltaproteobacteria bacterium]